MTKRTKKMINKISLIQPAGDIGYSFLFLGFDKKLDWFIDPLPEIAA
jgi:hypothetical protein